MRSFRFASPFLAFAAAVLFILPVASHATPITYNLTGVTTSAGSLTGTVTIDSATDLVTAASITFNDSLVGSPVFTNIAVANAYNGLGQDYISGPSDSPLNYGGQVALYFDTANIGTGDLDICTLTTACGTEFGQGSFAQAYVSNGLGGPFYVTGGELDVDPPASGLAKEPSSLLLLGTGITCVAILMARMRRRGEA